MSAQVQISDKRFQARGVAVVDDIGVLCYRMGFGIPSPFENGELLLV